MVQPLRRRAVDAAAGGVIGGVAAFMAPGLTAAAIGTAAVGGAIAGATWAGSTVRWLWNLRGQNQPGAGPDPGIQPGDEDPALSDEEEDEDDDEEQEEQEGPKRRRGRGRRARHYAAGDEIPLESLEKARKKIATQNRVNRENLLRAKTLTKQYEARVRAYEFDRQRTYVPTATGQSTQIVIAPGARTQTYGNREGYFPGGGLTETDVNSGNGTAGNYRKIEAAVPMAGYAEWIGYNITHAGSRWVRVWNTNESIWQNWNTTTRTASNMPGHVTGPAPVDPRTDHQRDLARNGITILSIDPNGYGFQVTGTPES